jgi:hypothetical protein
LEQVYGGCRPSMIGGLLLERTNISNEKIEAYEATHYRVGLGQDAFILRIGEPSAGLRARYDNHSISCAVFITAFNPYGEDQSDSANDAAQARLQEALMALTGLIIEGAGADPTGAWPPEKSFLALGIDEHTAAHLGRTFHQDAVVWAGNDAVPKLLLLR